MNHITIELCTEDRARIDRLTEALEAMAQNQPRQLFAIDLGSAPENNAQEPEAAEPEQTQPEEETPTQPEVENVSRVAEVTVEDLRSKYMSLATTPKKEEARQLIKLYADKISDVPVDKRAELLEKLTALEG